MSGRRILISGAGIAGGVLAYWLGKAGFQVLVIERAPQLRAAGQTVDMEGPAVDVVKRMGVEHKIKGKTTGDKGLCLIGDNNNVITTFELGDTGSDDLGFTSQYEITRGLLVKILYEAADAFDNVEFRFDCTVESLEQRDDSVVVEFNNEWKTETFDVVAAADGLGSRTRDLILSLGDRKSCIKSLDSWVAFMSIPSEKQDAPRSRVTHYPGSRAILIRPLSEKASSAYLILNKHKPELKAFLKKDVETQKRVWADLFADAGWEAPRVIDAMMKTDNFYFTENAQVRLDEGSWSRGRCALVGDAAYSPSLGMGTTLAIMGAYILAGELTRSPEDPAAAFEMYQKRLQDYAKDAQVIPLGGYLPQLLTPETKLGIYILRFVAWFVAMTGIFRLFGGDSRPKAFDMPEHVFEKVG